MIVKFCPQMHHRRIVIKYDKMHHIILKTHHMTVKMRHNIIVQKHDKMRHKIIVKMHHSMIVKMHHIIVKMRQNMTVKSVTKCVTLLIKYASPNAPHYC